MLSQVFTLPATATTPPPQVIAELENHLKQRFPEAPFNQLLLVDVTVQRMFLIEAGQIQQEFVISTAAAGTGSQSGSNKTPLGAHRIKRRYGDGAALGTIFKGRQNTGRIAKILTNTNARSTDDNITTRILWLDGLEPGQNKGGSVDSYKRYIYIHGTDEEGRLGTPASHGCVRMKNTDVVSLYNRLGKDVMVFIAEQSQP